MDDFGSDPWRCDVCGELMRTRMAKLVHEELAHSTPTERADLMSEIDAEIRFQKEKW